MENQKVKLDENFAKVSRINILLTVAENIAFLVLGYWDYKVLLGSLLGLLTTTLFFWSICVSVPKALSYGDPELAQKSIRASRQVRTAIMAVCMIVAFKVPVFNWIAALIPLLFTRISISFLNFAREEEAE